MRIEPIHERDRPLSRSVTALLGRMFTLVSALFGEKGRHTGESWAMVSLRRRCRQTL